MSKIEIESVNVYGEYDLEYMNIVGRINGEVFSLLIAPKENIVFNTFLDEWNKNLTLEEKEKYVRYRVELVKYFTDKRNNKLLKILREAVVILINRNRSHITVADSNKHLNYYINKLLDCFIFNEEKKFFALKEGCTFVLDEHLQK